MNRLQNILSKWNFKKIVVWYLVLAVVAGAVCLGTIGYIYRQRLNFAWQYSRLEEIKDTAALQIAAKKTADASADVVDVLILDGNNKIIYSAKNSQFSAGTLDLTRASNEKKYLLSANHPNAVFQYVKSEEFMLKSIINKDFGRIRLDYDDDSIFEKNLSSKTVYMLSRVRVDNSNNKVYVISVPTSVPGGMTVLKLTSALAMLFFCVYWVLIALWIYNDAAKCKLSAIYWGLIGLFTNIIGLIVYKIYKRTMTVCPQCGAAQSEDCLYCSFCGSELGERCKNCGSKIGSKDIYCRHCGNKIK